METQVAYVDSSMRGTINVLPATPNTETWVCDLVDSGTQIIYFFVDIQSTDV